MTHKEQFDDLTVPSGGSLALNANVTSADLNTSVAGDGLTGGGGSALAIATDGVQTDELDLSITPTWTGQHQFSAGLDTRGNVVDDTTTVWDSTAGSLGSGLIPADDVGTSELDLSIAPTWTSSHDFETGLTSQSNINVNTASYAVDGTPVVGSQEAAIASLTNNQTATTTDGALETIPDTTTNDASAEIERNITELNAKLDSILTALRNHGLIAT